MTFLPECADRCCEKQGASRGATLGHRRSGRDIHQLIDAGTNRERFSRMDVGEELRQARLARGLTLEQISAATKVAYKRLDAIERNNVFDVPLVYVRGYVGEFARTVGLDPDDLAERYIAQFSTTRSTPVLLDLANMAEDEANLAELEEPIPAAPAPRRPSQPRPHDYPDDDDFASPPLRPAEFNFWRPRHGRWGTLVVSTIAAAAIGFMIGWNTDRYASGSNVADQQVSEQQGVTDSTGGTTSDAAQTPAIPANVPETQVSREDASTATRAPHSASNTTSALHTPFDLDGAWTMTNEVQDSSLKTFRGLRLEYQLQLQQDGERVTGKGQKVSENGRALRRSARTPITLAGTVEGDEVHLKFREKGRRRESGGTFQYQLAGDGSLRGTFTSNAARSSGQSVVRRVP